MTKHKRDDPRIAAKRDELLEARLSQVMREDAGMCQLVVEAMRWFPEAKVSAVRVG